MTTPTRELLIRLSSHMAYMQGQLEARHELDDPEDFYWYRESVALRQKVIDALAEDGPAVPVAVSERLPEAEDCDAEGRCWWWYPPVPEQTYGYWAHEDDATDRAYEEWPSAWLPAHALPLPSGEVAA